MKKHIRNASCQGIFGMFFFKLIGIGVCWCFCFVKMDVTQQDLEFLTNSFWKGYQNMFLLFELFFECWGSLGVAA